MRPAEVGGGTRQAGRGAARRGSPSRRPETDVRRVALRGWRLSYRPTTVGAVLEELRITGLGVIEDTTLPLTRGMNVITGETGAGKTMVVTGLGLLFGGRADAARVRAEPGRAVVEGRLRLAGAVAASVAERVVDAGSEPDEAGSVLLARTVTAEGRSRAHVGGRSVPVAVLGELGEQVVAVHGQSDQLRLLRPAEQRGALDRFAGPDHDKLLAQLRERYGQWRAVEDDLADRRRNARERSQEADLLRLGLDEITRVDPQPGEDDALKAEAQRLEHAEGLRTAAQVAHAALAGSGDEAPDVTSLLALARRTLETQSTVDSLLGELAGRLDEVATLAGDISVELGGYLDALDADPDRLQEIYERRAALRALTRKYAEDVDGVIAWAEHARTRLSELDTSDELLEELDRERVRLAGEVAELAARVRAAGIEVVFAGAGGPPTLVFDEVDAGVGGRAAVEIGRRLARLARAHQVLVVTHLPQVAAFADRHLVVAKDTGGAVTTSGVRVVEDTERARELARMLAGLPDSDLGIAHAEELLAVAAREKHG